MVRKILKKDYPADFSIDLIDCKFDWNVGDAEENDSENDQHFASITSISSTKNKITGSCLFGLRRVNSSKSNFLLTCTYYYALEYEKELSEKARKNKEIDLANTSIWVKFSEIANFTLRQAAIDDYEIPLYPISIKYERQGDSSKKKTSEPSQ